MDKPEIDFPDGPPPSELEITDLTEGDGPEAQAGQTVSVHYVGVAHSTGEEFDASYNRGEPLQFRLGVGQVISGWDNGVLGMKVGGRRRLVIDRKSTRLNSSHANISYAVFCLKKKNKKR